MTRTMVLGWLWTLAHGAQAQEKPAPKPIDATTIAAYEKLGAIHGGIQLTKVGVMGFTAGKAAAAKGLRSFHFEREPKVKPPPVAVPFGLEFGNTVTGLVLQQLADLKNLSSLELFGTRLTNAGLRDLAAATNLSALEIGDTQVIEAGVATFKKALPRCEIRR